MENQGACYSSFFFFKQKTAYEMLRSLVGSEMCIRDRCTPATPREASRPRAKCPRPSAHAFRPRFSRESTHRPPGFTPSEPMAWPLRCTVPERPTGHRRRRSMKRLWIMPIAALVLVAGCFEDDNHSVVAPHDTTAPAAPRGLTSVTGDGEVFLHWQANTCLLYTSPSP